MVNPTPVATIDPTVAGLTPTGSTGVDHACCPPKRYTPKQLHDIGKALLPKAGEVLNGCGPKGDADLTRDLASTTLGVDVGPQTVDGEPVSPDPTAAPLAVLGPGGDFTTTIPAQPATDIERQKAILDHERAREADEIGKELLGPSFGTRPPGPEAAKAARIRRACDTLQSGVALVSEALASLTSDCRSFEALKTAHGTWIKTEDGWQILAERLHDAAMAHTSTREHATCPKCGAGVNVEPVDETPHPVDPRRPATYELAACSEGCGWSERVTPDDGGEA